MITLVTLAFSLITWVKLDIHNSANYKGYTALLGENTNPDNHGDLHEGFDLGWESLPGSPDKTIERDDGAMAGSNVWPNESDIPGFREDTVKY